MYINGISYEQKTRKISITLGLKIKKIVTMFSVFVFTKYIILVCFILKQIPNSFVESLRFGLIPKCLLTSRELLFPVRHVHNAIRY